MYVMYQTWIVFILITYIHYIISHWNYFILTVPKQQWPDDGYCKVATSSHLPSMYSCAIDFINIYRANIHLCPQRMTFITLIFISSPPPPSPSWCTRWFKYDWDDLCVNKLQFVPVIFEPSCSSQRVGPLIDPSRSHATRSTFCSQIWPKSVNNYLKC
jgi:hypothetical protein